MPPEPAPPSRAKTLAIVLGGVAVAALVSCLAVALLLKTVVADALGPEQWRAGAIAPADLPRVYGVSLPARPPLMRSRVGGFQDPIYEVLFQLPPGGEAAFLSTNGLRRDATGEAPFGPGLDEAKRELRVHQSGGGPITVTPLAGFEDLLGGDGGYVELFRSGALLEADGQTWVYLVAFGT
ncbi:MAG: hypothetical protein IT380_21190 [Myxococcales bacterium]|nr:hypothetical protein [Myxococcales bacterium]